jgi:hypothetical protein
MTPVINVGQRAAAPAARVMQKKRLEKRHKKRVIFAWLPQSDSACRGAGTRGSVLR